MLSLRLVIALLAAAFMLPVGPAAAEMFETKASKPS